MKPRQCMRCGHWWTTDVNRQHITGRICPDCIPSLSQPLTNDSSYGYKIDFGFEAIP